MEKYKTINLIRKILGFPFVVVLKTLKFIFLPLTVIIGFLMSNWEEEWDRKYYIKELKADISFGFWK